jgi:hypothetical protein
MHCEPTPYPANCNPILPTDALSTDNRRPIHCQPPPYPLPADTLSRNPTGTGMINYDNIQSASNAVEVNLNPKT